MGFYKMPKPQPFEHKYIYVDERKEKLKKVEEQAKRELGMLPPESFSPQEIKGKFVEGTTHLKRRKEGEGTRLSNKVIVVALFVCFFLLHYLWSGEWLF